jgi:hypothetical protein
MVLYENEYAVISHNETERSLDLAWRAFAPSRCFRRIFADLADLLRARRKPRLWLCDHSLAKIIGPEDQTWLIDEWLPASWATIGGGVVRRLAVVRAHDYFGRLSVEKISSRLSERCASLRTAIFECRAEASDWLQRGEVE